MSCPLTSIVNPLNEKEIFLFYLTENKGTGLEIYNYTKREKVGLTAFKDNITTPPEDDLIANPGSFSSLLANGLLNVYGLVRLSSTSTKTDGKSGSGPEVNASDTKLVAQLSPVFKLIIPEDGSKVKGVALTTTLDPKGQAWMYCITTNDKDIPVIKSIKLGWKESSVTSTIVTSKPPLLSTNLASVYDPLLGRNLIIYQDKKTLRIVDATNTDDKEIPNTGDSRNMTGLACVPVKGDKGGVKLYLYYFADKGGQLQRVVRDEDGNWSDSDGREEQESEESTFLTATKIGEDIAVYYMLKGDTSKIHTHLDPIDGPARVEDS